MCYYGYHGRGTSEDPDGRLSVSDMKCPQCGCGNVIGQFVGVGVDVGVGFFASWDIKRDVKQGQLGH